MMIAVLVNQENHVEAFENGGTIRLYEKEGSVWTSVKEFLYRTDDLVHPAIFRERLKAICDWMQPCNVLAAKRFRGTYQVVFERYGVSMWEMDGFAEMNAENFLDDISKFHSVERDNECCVSNESENTIAPIEQKLGYYSIDLTDVMKHRTNLNSQQILLPFFKNTPFKQLEILCDHVPKWFERELNNFSLISEVEENQNGLQIRLFRKN